MIHISNTKLTSSKVFRVVPSSEHFDIFTGCLVLAEVDEDFVVDVVEGDAAAVGGVRRTVVVSGVRCRCHRRNCDCLGG